MAKILRGKYYHDGNFLNVKQESNPSLMWRSILWGRSLFSEGYRWRIGNGARVFIVEDPWLNKKGGKFPIWVKEEWKNKRVIDLLEENGAWKEDCIKEASIPTNAEEILSIPRGNCNSNDEIIWNPDQNSCFTMKSAYKLAKKLNAQGETSRSDNSQSRAIWKFIWKSNCYPREKLTVWKNLNNNLQTKVNLSKKGIVTNVICYFCGAKPESTEHIFWNCKFSKKVWTDFL